MAKEKDLTGIKEIFMEGIPSGRTDKTGALLWLGILEVLNKDKKIEDKKILK